MNITRTKSRLSKRHNVKEEIHLWGKGLIKAPPSPFSNQPQRMVDSAVLLRLRSY
jgi:hypothetical protein